VLVVHCKRISRTIYTIDMIVFNHVIRLNTWNMKGWRYYSGKLFNHFLKKPLNRT